MTAEIVNLRRARKAKARAEADRTARQNRTAFGLPKAERLRAEAEARREAAALDGHRLDAPAPGDRGEGGAEP